MKTIILILFLMLILSGCATIQANLSTPPSKHEVIRPTTDKELISEWQRSLIKVKEWQAWYHIQVGSNYYKGVGNDNIL